MVGAAARIPGVLPGLDIGRPRLHISQVNRSQVNRAARAGGVRVRGGERRAATGDSHV